MKKYRATIFAVKLLVVISLFQISEIEGQIIQPLLKTALRNSEGGDKLNCWLYLDAKPPLTSEQRDEIFSSLSPKQKARRLKRSRLPLVNKYDIPVNGKYLEDLRRSGIKIRKISKWLNAVSVSVSKDELLRLLKEKKYIQKADLVKKYSLPDDKKLGKKISSPYENHKSSDADEVLFYGKSFNQLSLIGVTDLHREGITGKNIRITILDTGFDRLDHESIAPINIIKTRDFVNDDDDVTNDPNDMGDGSHGRMVLSVIGGKKEGELIGSAYEAEYMLAKTENTVYERPIEEDNWIAGIEWAEANGADIVTSSLGYTIFDSEYSEYNHYAEDLDGNTAPVTIAADIAAALGVIVVNAAGNSGDSDGKPENNTLIAPADADSVITVGATDPTGNRIYFSSVGPTADGRIKPDIMAQGYYVYGAENSPTDYGYVNGTSFATPITAGAVALILQVNPFIDPGEMINLIHNTGSLAEMPNYREGYGLLNAEKAAFYFAPKITITGGTLFPEADEYFSFKFTAAAYSEYGAITEAELYCDYGDQSQVSVVARTDDNYHFTAEIPNLTGGGAIAVKIKIINARQDTLWYPYSGADLIIEGIRDTIPPDIFHYEITDYPTETACYLYADISDNLNVERAKVYWRKNGDSPRENEMINERGNRYFLNLTELGEIFSETDSLLFKIEAADSSGNRTVYPSDDSWAVRYFYSGRGKTLLLNDTGADSSTNIALIHTALSERGYKITETDFKNFENMSTDGYSAIIIVGGDNTRTDTDFYPETRDKISEFVKKGGGLFVEGKYASFLHYDDLIGEICGIYKTYSGGVYGYPLARSKDHRVMNYPYVLPDTLKISGEMLGWFYNVTGQSRMYTDGEAITVAGITEFGNGFAAVFSGNIGNIEDSRDAAHLVVNIAEYIINNKFTAISENELKVQDFKLFGNYPNPFNPETTIKFSIKIPGTVELKIYDISGKLVRTLKKNTVSAGKHEILWDGKDERGLDSASGIYLYRLISPEGSEAFGKMSYVK